MLWIRGLAAEMRGGGESSLIDDGGGGGGRGWKASDSGRGAGRRSQQLHFGRSNSALLLRIRRGWSRGVVRG